MFDQALASSASPHDPTILEVVVRVQSSCSLMVDAAVRLLSLLNQLVACTKRVSLEFEDVEGAMGYLNRIRFFEFLSSEVVVRPYRPTVSMGSLLKGKNANLVELVQINRGAREKQLPTELAERLG